MYLHTVKQKITELRAAIKDSIPPENHPECIVCFGKGRRAKTDEEITEERKVTPPDFHKFLLNERDCGCVNPERVKYDRSSRTVAFLEKAYKAIHLPEEYQEMCFGNYLGSVSKDFFRFVEQKSIDVDGVVKRGFLFVGAVGVGKTHMAVAIVNGLMYRHHLACLYVDVAELLAELRESYNTNRAEGGFSETAIIKRYQRIPVLLLDDISVEKTSEWVRDRIFQIVNWRYSNKLITLATSNDHPEDLVDKLGARTVSRLKALTDFIEIDSEDGTDQRGKKLDKTRKM